MTNEAIRESLASGEIVHVDASEMASTLATALCESLEAECEDCVEVDQQGMRWVEYWGEIDGETWRVHVDFAT